MEGFNDLMIIFHVTLFYFFSGLVKTDSFDGAVLLM